MSKAYDEFEKELIETIIGAMENVFNKYNDSIEKEFTDAEIIDSISIRNELREIFQEYNKYLKEKSEENE